MPIMPANLYNKHILMQSCWQIELNIMKRTTNTAI